ncbi:MAG: hypothetical protein QUS11_08290 [Candidatus Fermentibacter sp.]|nr:hypothetical protein [Candidatus Fermentibacter sp.]
MTRAIGTAGIGLGLVSMLCGTFLAAVSGDWGRRVAASATGLVDGLDGAERAMAVLGEDLEGTTSLMDEIGGAVWQTAGIVDQTRATLVRVDSAGSRMIDFSDLLSDDLEDMSSLLGPLASGRFTAPASRLRLASSSGDTVLVLLSNLRSRLGSLSSTLRVVSASVDSLAADIEVTSATMSSARNGIDGVRRAAALLAVDDIASAMILLPGLLLFFLGVQEVLLGSMLRKSGMPSPSSPSPAPGAKQDP